MAARRVGAHGRRDPRRSPSGQAGGDRRRARRARRGRVPLRRAGCRGSCSSARWRWTTPNGCLPAQNPSRRRIGARRRRHHRAQRLLLGLHGADPAADLRRRGADARVAAAVRRRAEPRTRRSAPCSAPGRDRGRRHPRRRSRSARPGYAIYDDLVHGYGVDIMPPIVDREQLADPPEDGGRTFERRHGDRDPAEPRHSGRAHGPPARRPHDRPRRTAPSRCTPCRSSRSSRRRMSVGAALDRRDRACGAADRRRGGPGVRAPARHLLRRATRSGCARSRRSAASSAADSFEAALEHPDVEAVLLVTPNDVHAEQALACAERGRARLRREADRGHGRGRRADARPRSPRPGSSSPSATACAGSAPPAA